MPPLGVVANNGQKLQFSMAPNKKLPQASPPEIRRPNPNHGPDILGSVMDESSFPQSRVLGGPVP